MIIRKRRSRQQEEEEQTGSTERSRGGWEGEVGLIGSAFFFCCYCTKETKVTAAVAEEEMEG